MNDLEPQSLPDPPAEEAGAAINLEDYWRVVLKRWRLVAVCGFLSLSWAVLHTILTPPSYRATATIDVEPERSGPLDVGSASQMFFMYDPNYLSTQLRLMQSREMAERVVERLKLAPGAPARPAAGNSLLADSAVSHAAIEIQSGIAVSPIKDTNMVELSYVDSDPKRAAQITNAAAEAYIEWSTESKYRYLGQTSRLLAIQILQLRGDLEAEEKRLLEFGKHGDLATVDALSGSAGSQPLNKDYSSAVADRIAKEAHYNELLASSNETAASSSSSAAVGPLQAEQNRLERQYAEKLNVFKPEWPAMQQLKTEIEKGRQHVDAVIKDAAEKARSAARTEYLTALRREESLKNTLQAQRTEAAQSSGTAIEYNNLRVEVETKRNLLDTFVRRQSEMDLVSRMSSQRESSVRIVDPALTPTYRFAPSYRHNGTRGLLMGLVVGLGLAFFLEYLDRSLRSPEQVESFLKLPALGVIPSVGTSPGDAGAYGYGYGGGRRRKKDLDARAADGENAIELLPHAQPRSTVSEAYRAVRTALLLSRAGGVKSITVTSCFPREGKSVTTINIAIVLGQLGKRVLVVDADLHKPRVHEIVRCSNRVGLVSVLAENLDPSQAVLKTTLPGVFVLPAGPISPNPSGLLSSPAMSEFLVRAAVTFDFVIIDTPPVLPVADAILIGHQTDGVLLCVRGGKTSRDQVRRMRDKLQRSGVRILGVLINNLERPVAGKYGGQYGYEYAGYGYTEEVPKNVAGGATTKS